MSLPGLWISKSELAFRSDLDLGSEIQIFQLKSTMTLDFGSIEVMEFSKSATQNTLFNTFFDKKVIIFQVNFEL